MTAKKPKKRQDAKKQQAGARGKSAKWLEEEGLLKIAGWARDGCTDEEVAKNMGVAYSTLRVWRDKFPALSAALKCARDIADRKVENKLFERAQGYTIKLKKTFKVKKERYDELGRKIVCEELQTGEDEVHIPADVTAQIFWLKNRKPDKWRDKPDAKTDDAELPDDGLKEQMEAAASKMCAGADDSDMLPEDEGDGKDENA
ncbi:MAG: hypothetical protein IJ337_01070 [Clostridia bacterium]|nr:hypothetical protein [Clostridia bacterium]